MYLRKLKPHICSKQSPNNNLKPQDFHFRFVVRVRLRNNCCCQPERTQRAEKPSRCDAQLNYIVFPDVYFSGLTVCCN